MLAKFITYSFFSTPVFPYWLDWCDFWSIWQIVERRNDLERLVAWARRKKLKGVREHYKFLLMETEVRLAEKNIRHHNLFVCATTLNLVFRMFFPSPTSHKKGAAVRYKL
jgi:hypothetical protein